MARRQRRCETRISPRSARALRSCGLCSRTIRNRRPRRKSFSARARPRRKPKVYQSAIAYAATRMTAAVTGLPVSIQRTEKLIQLLIPRASYRRADGDEQFRAGGDCGTGWARRGRRSNGRVREQQRAAKSREGQQLQRLHARAPAVRLVLVGEARLAADPRGEGGLVRQEGRNPIR